MADTKKIIDCSSYRYIDREIDLLNFTGELRKKKEDRIYTGTSDESDVSASFSG